MIRISPVDSLVAVRGGPIWMQLLQNLLSHAGAIAKVAHK